MMNNKKELYRGIHDGYKILRDLADLKAERCLKRGDYEGYKEWTAIFINTEAKRITIETLLKE